MSAEENVEDILRRLAATRNAPRDDAFYVTIGKWAKDFVHYIDEVKRNRGILNTEECSEPSTADSVSSVCSNTDQASGVMPVLDIAQKEVPTDPPAHATVEKAEDNVVPAFEVFDVINVPPSSAESTETIVTSSPSLEEESETPSISPSSADSRSLSLSFESLSTPVEAEVPKAGLNADELKQKLAVVKEQQLKEEQEKPITSTTESRKRPMLTNNDDEESNAKRNCPFSLSITSLNPSSMLFGMSAPSQQTYTEPESTSTKPMIDEDEPEIEEQAQIVEVEKKFDEPKPAVVKPSVVPFLFGQSAPEVSAIPTLPSLFGTSTEVSSVPALPNLFGSSAVVEPPPPPPDDFSDTFKFLFGVKEEVKEPCPDADDGPPRITTDLNSSNNKNQDFCERPPSFASLAEGNTTSKTQESDVEVVPEVADTSNWDLLPYNPRDAFFEKLSNVGMEPNRVDSTVDEERPTSVINIDVTESPEAVTEPMDTRSDDVVQATDSTQKEARPCLPDISIVSDVSSVTEKSYTVIKHCTTAPFASSFGLFGVQKKKSIWDNTPAKPRFTREDLMKLLSAKDVKTEVVSNATEAEQSDVDHSAGTTDSTHNDPRPCVTDTSNVSNDSSCTTIPFASSFGMFGTQKKSIWDNTPVKPRFTREDLMKLLNVKTEAVTDDTEKDVHTNENVHSASTDGTQNPNDKASADQPPSDVTDDAIESVEEVPEDLLAKDDALEESPDVHVLSETDDADDGASNDVINADEPMVVDPTSAAETEPVISVSTVAENLETNVIADPSNVIAGSPLLYDEDDAVPASPDVVGSPSKSKASLDGVANQSWTETIETEFDALTQELFRSADAFDNEAQDENQPLPSEGNDVQHENHDAALNDDPNVSGLEAIEKLHISADGEILESDEVPQSSSHVAGTHRKKPESSGSPSKYNNGVWTVDPKQFFITGRSDGLSGTSVPLLQKHQDPDGSVDAQDLPTVPIVPYSIRPKQDDEEAPEDDKTKVKLDKIVEINGEPVSRHTFEEVYQRAITHANTVIVIDENGERIELRQKVTEVVLDDNAESPNPKPVAVHKSIVKHLKPHQATGIQFLYNCLVGKLSDVTGVKYLADRNGAILSHCMGLGKTLQAIAFLHTIMTHDVLKQYYQRAMIICPAGLLYNWANEFVKWLGDGKDPTLNTLKTIDLSQDTAKNWDQKKRNLREWQKGSGTVLLISLDLFSRKDSFKHLEPYLVRSPKNKLAGADIIICDESHKLSNDKSARSENVRKLTSLSRIGLTGTPLQNKLEEYYHIIDWVAPGMLGKIKDFRSEFAVPIKEGATADADEVAVQLMKSQTAVLNRQLDLVMDRKDYAYLATILPPKKEYVLFLRMTKKHEDLYRKWMGSQAQKLSPFEREHFLYRLGTQPYKVLEDQRAKHTEAWFGRDITNADREVYTDSEKINIVLDLIKMFEQEGAKAIIFSQYLEPIVVLKAALKAASRTWFGNRTVKHMGNERWGWEENLDYYTIIGDTNMKDRSRMLTKFNDANNHRGRILFMTKAACEGLNMTGATKMILFEAKHNPELENQALFRAYRIGQTKPFTAFRLVYYGTMESCIFKRQIVKQQNTARILDNNGATRTVFATEVNYSLRFEPAPPELNYTTQPNYDPGALEDPTITEFCAAHKNVLVDVCQHDALVALNEDEKLTQDEVDTLWSGHVGRHSVGFASQSCEDLFRPSSSTDAIDSPTRSTSLPEALPSSASTSFASAEVPSVPSTPSNVLRPVKPSMSPIRPQAPSQPVMHHTAPMRPPTTFRPVKPSMSPLKPPTASFATRAPPVRRIVPPPTVRYVRPNTSHSPTKPTPSVTFHTRRAAVPSPVVRPISTNVSNANTSASVASSSSSQPASTAPKVSMPPPTSSNTPNLQKKSMSSIFAQMAARKANLNVQPKSNHPVVVVPTNGPTRTIKPPVTAPIASGSRALSSKVVRETLPSSQRSNAPPSRLPKPPLIIISNNPSKPTSSSTPGKKRPPIVYDVVDVPGPRPASLIKKSSQPKDEDIIVLSDSDDEGPGPSKKPRK